MTPSTMATLKLKVKEMFFHAYNNYLEHAFPADELMPLSCKGRYRGSEPSRGDIDDSLGNYSLTLIDSLDTLFLINETEKFEHAVRLVLQHVHFDRDVVVSVFEANIRVLGGLLGGHIAAVSIRGRNGAALQWYQDELLHLAKDLGLRLLPSFNSSTGIPFPRVNLKYGMRPDKVKVDVDTCTACAGSMLLEFAALSRLTDMPEFEQYAKRAMDYLWEQRNRHSDLVGTVININTGDWVRRESGVGAGIDSYYEYLLKAYVLLGNETYLHRFNTHYMAIKKYVENAATSSFVVPMLVDVLMHQPANKAKNFMDALHAFWPALQVLLGDLKPAIALHEVLHHVVQRHHFLPEAFTTDFHVHWAHHPLRPEFIESTYFLYRATGDPHYLEVGAKVLHNLENYARVPCGFAAIKDVRTMSHDDQLDSFVLAETFKYLYLLFADPSELPVELDNYIFTTEAHILPLNLASVHNGGSNARFSKASGALLPILPSVSVIPESELFPETVTSITRDCPNLQWWNMGHVDKEHNEKQLHQQRKEDPLSSVNVFLQMTANHHKKGARVSSSSSSPALRSHHGKCSAVAHQIRSPLRQFLSNFYPDQGSGTKTQGTTSASNQCRASGTQRRVSFTLRPENLDISDPQHVAQLNIVGIQILTVEGTSHTRLYHTPTQAASPALAEQGTKFMQDMIRLQRELQEQETASQNRLVVIMNPPYLGQLQLRAGPSRFSVFPEKVELSDAANEEVSLSQLGVWGPVMLYPGVDSLACDHLEKLSKEHLASLTGAIVVVKRGGCMFVRKARLLHKLGAKAGIVVDLSSPGVSMESQGLFSMSGDDEGEVNLPFVFLFTVEAEQLLTAVRSVKSAPLTVLLTSGEYAAAKLWRAYQVERSKLPEQNTPVKQTAVERNEETSTTPTEPMSMEHEVALLLTPVSWQLYSVRYLLQQHSYSATDKHNAPVTMRLSRVNLRQEHSILSGMKPTDTLIHHQTTTLTWEMVLVFNLASGKLATLMREHAISGGEHAKLYLGQHARFLKAALDWLHVGLTDMPVSMQDVLMHFGRLVLDLVHLQQHQLQMSDFASVEKMLSWLMEHQTSPIATNSGHELKIHLHCLHDSGQQGGNPQTEEERNDILTEPVHEFSVPHPSADSQSAKEEVKSSDSPAEPQQPIGEG